MLILGIIIGLILGGILLIVGMFLGVSFYQEGKKDSGDSVYNYNTTE